jgi:AmmeMemoRadiSam system protein B
LSYKPILRPLDFQPVIYQNQQMWLLRDPLQLTDQQLIVPTVMAQMLVFCDGTRTPEEIHAAFCQQLQGQVDFGIITNALDQLDAACLLDNERSQKAHQAVLDSYRAAPHRIPALADLSYPANPQQLASLLESYSDGDNLNEWPDWQGRGLVSPHIDYQRGGFVYAQVWQRAKKAILEAELVLIFGTDHNGGPGTVTLTRQPYATPYGVMPTDLDLIDKVAGAIGTKMAFSEELHHRGEHSVELSAVWLHHIYHQQNMPPRPMVPILCGSFQHFLMNGARPANSEQLNAAIETIRQETSGKRVLAVASVDLAHVGPNFGDDFPMDDSRRAQLQQVDANLIRAILKGDAEDFYNQISVVQNRHRICGFSSIYLMLRLLGDTTGIEIAYDHCPADSQNTSLVSICGLLLE